MVLSLCPISSAATCTSPLDAVSAASASASRMASTMRRCDLVRGRFPSGMSDAEAGNRFAARLPLRAAQVVIEVLQARCSASRSSGTDRSTPSRDSIRVMRAETVLR